MLLRKIVTPKYCPIFYFNTNNTITSCIQNLMYFILLVQILKSFFINYPDIYQVIMSFFDMTLNS